MRTRAGEVDTLSNAEVDRGRNKQKQKQECFCGFCPAGVPIKVAVFLQPWGTDAGGGNRGGDARESVTGDKAELPSSYRRAGGTGADGGNYVSDMCFSKAVKNSGKEGELEYMKNAVLPCVANSGVWFLFFSRR